MVAGWLVILFLIKNLSTPKKGTIIYKQLSQNERFLINIFFNNEHKSITEISKILNRSKSTISRELKRNNHLGYYDHEIAHKKSKERKWHNHSMYLLKYEEYTKDFIKIFNNKINGVKSSWIKLKPKYPNCPSWRQIFNWIKSNRWLLKRSDRLRQYYKKGKKRTSGIFSKFKNSFILPIWTRPKYIDNRSEFGHWEANLIIGKKANGFHNLITLQERKSRMVFITKIQSKDPFKLNSTIYQLIKKNNLNIKSITIDNGVEFSKIGLLAKWINCKIYVCEPYASYQRGSNEHVNGIVRRFWKKGTNFSLITNENIFQVQNLINNMSREMFNWKSSKEIYTYLNK